MKSVDSTLPNIELSSHMEKFDTFHDIQLTQSYVLDQHQNSVSTNLCRRKRLSFIILSLTLVAICLIFFFFDDISQLYQKIVLGFNSDAQIYDLIQLNSTSALCLDGSPASYLISRTGDPSKILIFFPPGAWCAQTTDKDTLQSFYLRSKTPRGSSKFLSKQSIMKFGILSNHPNNYFKDWKKVYFHYCDGSGFQGTKKDPIQYKNELLYLRGHNITVNRFQDLEERIGLFTKAQKVVISGESAGGLAALMWTNYLASKVQKGQVRTIADASIFYKSETQNTNNSPLVNQFKNMMKLTNKQIDPPVPQCLDEFSNQKQNCMFAQNILKHIKVSLFVTQSLYDSYTLKHILGLDCVYKTIRNCGDSDMQIIEDNRVNVLNIVKQVGKDKKNGVWGLGCVKHETFSRPDFADENFSIPKYSMMTASQAISDWMSGKEQNNIHLDFNSWPDNLPCA